MSSRAVYITIDDERRVSGLCDAPPAARACLVLAHGAGAGMNHPFLEAVAAGLFERRIAVLRYQFLYMERGLKRPDPLARRLRFLQERGGRRASIRPAFHRFGGWLRAAAVPSFDGRPLACSAFKARS